MKRVHLCVLNAFGTCVSELHLHVNWPVLKCPFTYGITYFWVYTDKQLSNKKVNKTSIDVCFLLALFEVQMIYVPLSCWADIGT